MIVESLSIIGGSGEVIAEMTQGYRNAVSRGDISPEEALEKTNATARILKCLELCGMPFENSSTQLGILIEEGRRLRGLDIH